MCLFASVAQARYFPSGDTAMSKTAKEQCVSQSFALSEIRVSASGRLQSMWRRNGSPRQ